MSYLDDSFLLLLLHFLTSARISFRSHFELLVEKPDREVIIYRLNKDETETPREIGHTVDGRRILSRQMSWKMLEHKFHLAIVI